MGSKIVARTATERDVPEVVRLAGVMYGGIDERHTPTDEWRAAATEMATRRLRKDLVAFVVDHPDEPGRLVASGAGTVATRLPSPTNLTARAGYIQWVATDPEHRRKGYARAVMLALLDWYETQGVLVTELHATADGEPLYRQLGFGESGGAALRHRRH